MYFYLFYYNSNYYKYSLLNERYLSNFDFIDRRILCCYGVMVIVCIVCNFFILIRIIFKLMFIYDEFFLWFNVEKLVYDLFL